MISHCKVTYAATYFALQRIIDINPKSRFIHKHDCSLCGVIFLTRHNRIVGVLGDIPLAFRNRPCYTHANLNLFPAVMYQSTRIFITMKDNPYHIYCPKAFRIWNFSPAAILVLFLPVKARSVDAQVIQMSGDHPGGIIVIGFIKNQLYHRCCFLVYFPAAPCRFVLDISIGYSAGSTNALFPFHPDCRLSFLGNVPAIQRVDKIADRHIKPHRLSNILVTVIIGVQCNEANAQDREYLIQIIPDTNIISAKAGKVFHNNRMDFALLRILNHPLKCGSFEIGSGISIIHILHCFIGHIIIGIQIALKKQTLIFNTVAFILIIFAQISVRHG